jgi:hypothetical protein
LAPELQKNTQSITWPTILEKSPIYFLRARADEGNHITTGSTACI